MGKNRGNEVVTKTFLKAELSKLATKAELSKLATKAELSKLATKEELRALEKRLTNKMATKNYVKQWINITIEELSKDIRGNTEKINEVLEEVKAMRQDLAPRVTLLEDHQTQTESRLEDHETRISKLETVPSN